ncbi:MAG: nuclear transport factor 2 family protein [Gemmatimonadetes bacterium]|nr:nuclear transport factor 2 family protein [Gemmatimonadota bacterium]
MLHASAEAWNRGDLDGFLADYAEDATFVGSTGLIRGAAEIRRRYAEGYWSGGTPPDALRFEMLDVRVTGPATATAVGRYILYDRETSETTGTGLFTLSLGRIEGEWKILHDHSSADEQD